MSLILVKVNWWIWGAVFLSSCVDEFLYIPLWIDDRNRWLLLTIAVKTLVLREGRLDPFLIVTEWMFVWTSQGALVVWSLSANTGDMGPSPGSGRSPGGGHSYPLQYSCLENPMDRGVWWAIVHEVKKSRTRLKWLSTHTEMFMSSQNSHVEPPVWQHVEAGSLGENCVWVEPLWWHCYCSCFVTEL